ncbi:MAG TPA: helix-turn-helix transcriptional regulator [Gemmataceae bacterium]|jgi:transcriptional regulator with XRE-family HTH domain|nr:helix-turn-helix transcriptional regulator [Gemmataceae bacterium]
MSKTSRPKLVVAIATEMERQGLSAYALGKLAKVPAATITRILSGDRPDPQASTVERLAAGLGAEFVLTHLPEKQGRPRKAKE